MRFAIVGAGLVGGLRAQAIRAAGFETVAAADPDLNRARKLAPAAEADAVRIVTRRDVDAVLIAAPPQFHEAAAVAALEAGKPVLCEKPLAPDPEAARRILDAARSARVPLATGFNHRYFPAVAWVRGLIDQGRLGNILYVRAYAGHEGLSQFRSPAEHDARLLGGGALMDNGIHLVDLVRFLGGDFDTVYGVADRRAWALEGGAEDNGVALLRADDGRWASLHASWSEWRGYRWHVDVYGEQGVARAWYGPHYGAATFRDGRRLRRVFPASNAREKLRGWQSTVVRCFEGELRDFARRIADSGAATPAATGVDGVRAVEIAHAVYRSSHERSEIRLAPL